METKTARQEYYVSCPQTKDVNDQEEMELSDTQDPQKDSSTTTRNDNAWQYTPFQGFRDFCVKSNLHGLKYVGEPNNPISIRLLWAIAFAIAVLTATYFITNVYRKWDESPVILTVDPRVAEIQEIPFPAVTICPPFVLTKRHANQLLDKTNKSYDFNLKMIEKFCKEGDIEDKVNSIEEAEIVKNFQENTRMRCKDIFKWAWMKLEYEYAQYIYEDYVFPTPTINLDSRLCCTFNGMKPELIYRNLSDDYLINNTPKTPSYDWNPEIDFDAKEFPNKLSMPLRPFRTGSNSGLHIHLSMNDTYCERKTVFEVNIHQPGEAADFINVELYALTGGSYNYRVSPKLTRADDTLRNVRLKQRKCYFSSEKHLRFYRTYTQQNCLLDCLANITLRNCTCLPQYLPDMRGVELEVCGIYHSCHNDLFFKVFEGEMRKTCDCLPPCIELMYTVTESYMPLPESLGNTDVSMQIFFTEPRFYPLHRSAIYTFSEMLANLGGLLGLFLGFSFLSIVEILYFLCIGLSRFLQGRLRDLNSKCHGDKCFV